MAIVYDSAPIGKIVYDEEPAAAPEVAKKPAAKGGMWNLFGPAEELLREVSGAASAPIAGLAGLATGGDADVVRKLQSGLTYEPRTEAGQTIARMAEFLPGLLGQGAEAAGGGVTDFLSKSPVLRGAPAAAAGAGTNTLIQMLPAILAHDQGAPAAAERGKAAVESAKDQILNAHADEVTKRAQAAGLKLPPAYANPSLKNQLVEGVGGTSALGRDLSKLNQDKLTTLVRQDLGLSDKAPLSEPMLESVRKEAGKAHQAIAEGDQPFHATETYLDAVRDLDKEVSVARAEMPELFKKGEAIEKLQKSLDTSYMSPVTALELIKKLRRDADTFDAGAQPTPERLQIAKAYRRGAAAVEDMMKQNLEEQGRGQLYEDYKAARELIAKTYDVQKALDTSTGHIDASKLAKLLEDKKLSGGLKLVGETAKKYPSATLNPQQTKGAAATYWDVAVPWRIPTRRLAASDWYQKRYVGPPNRNVPAARQGLVGGAADPLAAIIAAMQAGRFDQTGSQ